MTTLMLIQTASLHRKGGACTILGSCGLRRFERSPQGFGLARLKCRQEPTCLV